MCMKHVNGKKAYMYAAHLLGDNSVVYVIDWQVINLPNEMITPSERAAALHSNRRTKSSTTKGLVLREERTYTRIDPS